MEVTGEGAERHPGRLIREAASGDEAAFTQLVAAYHDDMRRVCVVICGDLDIAEEAVQSAWLRAWSKIGSVRDPDRLRPWLVSVAVNEAKQLIRKRRRRYEMERSATPASERAADPAGDVDQLDLRAALGRLDADGRALLAMRYVAGFDSTELAIAIGLSPSGTRARLARLLAELREELDDE